MNLKVNNGHSFIHPKTGVMIGPGHFYESFDDEVEVDLESATSTSKKAKKDTDDINTTTLPPEGENMNGSSEPDGDTQG